MFSFAYLVYSLHQRMDMVNIGEVRQDLPCFIDWEINDTLNGKRRFRPPRTAVGRCDLGVSMNAVDFTNDGADLIYTGNAAKVTDHVQRSP